MSHFSYIKTSIREMDLLKKSLTNLNIAWKQEEKEILGYNGETHNVNLVIPQENIHFVIQIHYLQQSLQYQF